ncbi:hypothetical protein DYU11_13780 [Fibrisoma montanum]|uniref:FAD/NAD(P)-binding domain-containing protein n=1 Tax=Fibrisoma montanum TaxID=2305895 RepID=A0A418MCE1_9BACT|nr:FAD-dependent oxidoreductase [Fibrisoma montanum]RIV24029.1 hypothetical protein DYU11_13780 [Fibrisoma montanum]
MKPASTQIVLLGGGYVSVWAYRSLVRRLRSAIDAGHVQITVICPNTHHAFHGWTAETLTGILREQSQASPLAELMPKARLIQGVATALDTVAKVVNVAQSNGTKLVIPYDHLLLGIGAHDSEAIPGIRSFGYQIKEPAAFRRTKQAIQDLVAQAAAEPPALARQYLSFVVAGGGFTGVEIATNLAEYLTVLKAGYPSLQGIQPQIRLVHSGDRILPSLRPAYNRLVRYAEKTIAGYGIELVSYRRIVEINGAGALLNDGQFLPARLVISTVGQSRLVLQGTEFMARDNQQRLITNAYQQIPGHSTIWGGGDACHVPYRHTTDACPANALWAIKHGDYVGRNIARAIRGRRLQPFTYRGLGQSASLGLGKGISELYGLQFTGPIAWGMRWAFFHFFMPSRRVMVDALSDWAHLFRFRQRRALTADQPDARPLVRS